MRRLAPALCLATTACGPSAQSGPTGVAQDLIACSLGDGAAWSEDCRLERQVVGSARLLIVHRPDGGFRRFEVIGACTQVVEADGAQAVATRQDGAFLELTVGRERYRLPVAGLQADAGTNG